MIGIKIDHNITPALQYKAVYDSAYAWKQRSNLTARNAFYVLFIDTLQLQWYTILFGFKLSVPVPNAFSIVGDIKKVAVTSVAAMRMMIRAPDVTIALAFL